MAVVTGDVLRVVARFVYDNADDIVNVWHFVMGTLGTASDDVEVMDGIEEALGAWYDQFANAWSSDLVGVDLSGVNVRKDELLPISPFATGGTSATDGLPLQTSPMIQWQSDTPRRGSRIYLPASVESGNVAGVIDPANVTTLLDMAADVLAGFTSATYGMEFRRVAYDREADVVRELRTAFVPVHYRTQRRRRQGVGS